VERAERIASERDITVSNLVSRIDFERQSGNLSSSMRLFVLEFDRDQISEYEKRVRPRDMPGDAAVFDFIKTRATYRRLDRVAWGRQIDHLVGKREEARRLGGLEVDEPAGRTVAESDRVRSWHETELPLSPIAALSCRPGRKRAYESTFSFYRN
jgi:Ribbon-helix-helix domain